MKPIILLLFTICISLTKSGANKINLPITTFKKYHRLGIRLQNVVPLHNQGSQSIVYSATMIDTTETIPITRKVLLKSSKDPSLENEYEILKYLATFNRRDIVKVYYFIHDFESNYFTMILDFIDGMNLFQFQKTSPKNSFKFTKSIMTSISSTVEFLHSVGVYHRDIKSENILLKGNRGDCYPILIDFGFATRKKTAIDIKGSLAFLAPEYFAQGNIISRFSNSEKEMAPPDVFALGITFIEFMSGKEMKIHAIPNESRRFTLTKRLLDFRGYWRELDGIVDSMSLMDGIVKSKLTERSYLESKELIQGMINHDLAYRWNMKRIVKFLK